MPKTCLKFLSGFLIPSLNNEKFGSRLMWLDKEKQIFQIDWCHKSTKNWNEREADVFVEWDKAKGHYQPEHKEYFTKSKQRFRALLYKFTCQKKVIPLKSEEKLKKIYKIADKSAKTKSASEEESDEEMSIHDLSKIMEVNDDIYRRKSPTNSPSALGLEDHDYMVPIDCLSVAESGKEANIVLMDFNCIIPNESSLYPSNKCANDGAILMKYEGQPIVLGPEFVQECNDIEDTGTGLQYPSVNNSVEVQNCFSINNPVSYYHVDKTAFEKMNVSCTVEDQDLSILWKNYCSSEGNCLPDDVFQDILEEKE